MGTFCLTTLNYLPRAMGSTPMPRTRQVEILDGRTADLPGWQECGFELVAHRSAVRHWDDEGELASVHYPELEEMARKMTGADAALVSTHIRRNPEEAKRHHQLSPINFVHSDFAADHIEFIRRTWTEPSEAGQAALERGGVTADDVAGAARVVTLQFWRNLGPAKMDYPLAWCDARTVTPAEGQPIHVTNYAGTGATFDALAVVEPEDPSHHRWYCFPELKPDEVVAFRTYDTDLVRQGATFFTPHSAFRDPEVAEGRPARSSIELRATCLFLG